jgi:hypothetical protein
MVNEITEQAAREVLLRLESEASNPAYFEAMRRTGGWSFAWRTDLGRPPLGSHAWIVADNGRARRLGRREYADAAIADELAE